MVLLSMTDERSGQTQTLPEVKRGARRHPYDSQPLVEMIQEMLAAYNETERGLCEEAGLDKSTIARIRDGHRPSLTTLILLANHWNLPPNNMIELGGWPRLAFFETDASRVYSPEVVEIAQALDLATPDMRKQGVRLIRALLGMSFPKMAG